MPRFRTLLPVVPCLMLLAGAATSDPKSKTYQPPKVGQCAPDFNLRDHAGQPVQLSGFRGKQNVVLVFYRGSF